MLFPTCQYKGVALPTRHRVQQHTDVDPAEDAPPAASAARQQMAPPATTPQHIENVGLSRKMVCFLFDSFSTTSEIFLVSFLGCCTYIEGFHK